MKMRVFLFFGLFFTLLFISACSNNQKLELLHSSAKIISDEGKLGATVVTEGKDKGLKIVPTALYYELTIKNIGRMEIGSLENGLEAHIQPSNELMSVSNYVMGFNIFNIDDPKYSDSGLGHGHSFTSSLKPNQEGMFALNYVLGSSVQNSEVPLLPSSDKLKQLEKEALNATLIITLDKKEVARFKLNELKK